MDSILIEITVLILHSHSDGFDMKWLFYGALATLFVYRCISSWKIYDIMRKSRDGEVPIVNTPQPNNGGQGRVQVTSTSIDLSAANSVPPSKPIDAVWKHMIFQFFDVEIFNMLHLSLRTGIRGPSSPQRALRTLECVFEAAPQVKCRLKNIFGVYQEHRSSKKSTYVSIAETTQKTDFYVESRG